MPEKSKPLMKNAACKFLRNKMFYVNIADTPDRISNDIDDLTTQYWCLKTMQTVGLDNGFVNRDGCCSKIRSCYESSDL